MMLNFTLILLHLYLFKWSKYLSFILLTKLQTHKHTYSQKLNICINFIRKIFNYFWENITFSLNHTKYIYVNFSMGYFKERYTYF